MFKKAESKRRQRPATAYGAALRLLVRRPRTREELRRHLVAEEHPGAEVDEAMARLESDGYINDFDLSRAFIVARAERLRHSRTRLLRELGARGVAEAVAEAAWTDALDAGEVDPRQALQRQISIYLAGAGGRFDERKFHRVYSALLRAGHDRRLVESELEASRPKTDPNA